MCTILEQIYALSLGSKAKYLIFFYMFTVLEICFILLQANGHLYTRTGCQKLIPYIYLCKTARNI